MREYGLSAFIGDSGTPPQRRLSAGCAALEGNAIAAFFTSDILGSMHLLRGGFDVRC